MNVRMIKTGENATVNDGYGARLIEQGKAVLLKGEKKPQKAQKVASGKAEGDA